MLRLTLSCITFRAHAHRVVNVKRCSFPIMQVRRISSHHRFGQLLKPPNLNQLHQIRKIHPLILLLLKPFKFVAVLFGRNVLRKRLSKVEGSKLIHVLQKYHRIIALLLCCTIIYVFYHLEEVPLTKRKRFVPLTHNQFKKATEFIDENLLTSLSKTYPPSHPKVNLCESLVTKLLSANRKHSGISADNFNWRIIIVEDDAVGAYSVPSGLIVVNSGLFKVIANDSELAYVLAHEISHILLEHGMEKFVRASFIDFLMIFGLAALWCIIPNDGIAFVAHWFFNRITHTSMALPNSRDCEYEADDLGMQLASRACYNPKEFVNFWKKKHLLDQITDEKSASDFVKEVAKQCGKEPQKFAWNEEELPKSLQIMRDIHRTHPTNENRFVRMESAIDKMIDLRRMCHCSELPKTPHVSDYDLKLQLIESVVKHNTR